MLYAILIFLAAIWIFGAMRNWEAMKEKPVRIAYFLCDYTIEEKKMRDKNLARIGAWSALLYVAFSVVGNVMHTPLPRDPAEMLHTIAHSSP